MENTSLTPLAQWINRTVWMDGCEIDTEFRQAREEGRDLREDIDKVLKAYQAGLRYEEILDSIHAQWDETHHHDWCHTNLNAQVVAAALLYGENDYELTIARAVMPGFDTDCNGATCGSLWGVVHGVSALPATWTAPMQDRVRTGVHSYHDVSISGLANDMLAAAVKAR